MALIGLAIEFDITADIVHDSKTAPELMDKLPNSDCIVTKVMIFNPLVSKYTRKIAIPAIPRKKNSKVSNEGTDWC
ncbi:MAG: hypothetical protein RPS47_06930 [Colwellia sp.]